MTTNKASAPATGRHAAYEEVLAVIEKELEFCVANGLHLGSAACLAIRGHVRKLKDDYAASLVVQADPKDQ